jgi:predicted DNA-binding transcriptional regulator AlpA
MTKWLRFRNLKERQIVDSWPQLRNLVEKQGFPPGRMLGLNTRAWDEDNEVEPWLASRPIAGPEPRGAAKAGRGRPRKAETAAGKASPETAASP